MELIKAYFLFGLPPVSSSQECSTNVSTPLLVNQFSNGLVKKDGLVFLVKEGKVSQVNEDYTSDSVRISPKGIISYGQKPEKFVMKDGDIVSLDGKLQVVAAGCADSKTKKERFVLDHIHYKDGKYHGIYTRFTENGLCIQTEYANGKPLYDYCVISNNDGFS